MPDQQTLYETIANITGEDGVRTGEPMGAHTSFGAGGRADYYIVVQSENMFRDVVKTLRQADLPYFIIGNGTNVLVSDAGYHGAVISYRGAEFAAVSVTGETRITAGSGVTLEAISQRAEDAALCGFEGLSGIPGRVGGALTMNAGAYGDEMKDAVETVRAIDLDTEDLPLITLTNADMRFGYRTSIAKTRNLFFTEATFALQKGERAKIAARRAELGRQRREKQPLEYRSAGSTFKRPEGYFAGKLIEEAGLKGASEGGAQVSEKHAGFIVNRGGASATDIITLMRRVRETVRENSGILLEPEVILLGETL
ncbi:MAG: UDP-N-acetylmuramate dehydrogenase [Lachnospiraceae bacterium]|nr:UDP-N-acetylmuramate dehydrogenase [Lachnospiraceae bacterium]